MAVSNGFIPQQRWLRIIPVAVVMYTIAYVDRTNISLALPSMRHDLNMDAGQAGNAAGVFFWGYLLLQIPGGHLAERWSAKRVVSLLLVAWGASAAASGLVRTWQEFWCARLLLGVAEGGVFPATLVLLSEWFPRAERARANAYWMLCQPVAVIVSSPLSGWILGRWNWRVLLIAEGVLPFFWLLVWQALIDDRPDSARWISAREREFIESTLRRESVAGEPRAADRMLRSLFRPQVGFMIATYFLIACGGYGYLFWLPSALAAAMKLSNLSVGILFSVPYVVTGFAMVLNSRHSDQLRERRLHVALPLALGGLFLLAAVFSSERTPVLSFVFVCLAGAGSYAPLGPFWAIPSETLPRGVLGPAMGLVNAVGNLGGYFGPLVVGYINKRTGNFVAAFGLLAATYIVAAGMTLFLKSERIADQQQTARS